ncbi:MAG: hypothetical protein QM784_04645 [Polyangiaceae bacterium]
MFNLINFVHIKTLNSSVSLLYASYVSDGAFLRGTVMAGYWLVGAMLAMGILAGSAKWWPRYEFFPARDRWAVALTGAISLVSSFGVSSDPGGTPMAAGKCRNEQPASRRSQHLVEAEGPSSHSEYPDRPAC